LVGASAFIPTYRDAAIFLVSNHEFGQNGAKFVFLTMDVGSGEGTAEESPPAGRVTDETDYFRLADNPRRIVGLIDAPWAPEYADALRIETPEANSLMLNHVGRVTSNAGALSTFPRKEKEKIT
jgi:hypothetical protein